MREQHLPFSGLLAQLSSAIIPSSGVLIPFSRVLASFSGVLIPFSSVFAAPFWSVLLPFRGGRRATGAGLALAIVAIVAGCGPDAAGHAERRPAADSSAAERAAAVPYRVVSVLTPGTIVGRVTVGAETASHGIADDSSVTVAAAHARLCGTTRRVALVERHGDRLEGVVVWLADARAGKQLPVERRYEITSEGCALQPRVQAAIVGGMLNVRNSDPAEHRVSFLRAGDTVATVRESDAGQVVPTGKVMAHEGLVQARSDTYPWSRAWIRVFDHPYFAVTNRDGTFTLDSVPPGTYRLMAWDARLGSREQQVSVGGGTDARVDVTF